MEEIWKDVVGYEGFYEVSNMGNVRRKGAINAKKSTTTRKGYQRIGLSVNDKCKKFQVHRLVAMAFIPNIEAKGQVNHKNGIKSDNRACNLEWATQWENINHAVKSGLMDYGKISGEKNHRCNLSEAAARDIKFNYVKGKVTHKSLALKYNVTTGAISAILRGCSWKWLIQ